MSTPLPIQTTYFWRVNHYDLAGNQSGYSSSANFQYKLFLCGDANADGAVNIGDAVYIVNYIFKGGPAPVPYEAGDANRDGTANVGDAVYIINYIFKGGHAPCYIF